MNPDEHAAARLKRRSERTPRDGSARAYGSDRFLGVGSDGRASVAPADGREPSRASSSSRAPPVPLPERPRGVSAPDRAGAARDNLLRAYSSRSDMRSPRGSEHVGRHAGAASPREALSTTSAAAVAMATRRGTGGARSPRDINLLVDKLLSSVHGSPSAITTRRAVVRLHDSVGPVAIDAVRLSDRLAAHDSLRGVEADDGE
jgi:hypothetical protein